MIIAGTGVDSNVPVRFHCEPIENTTMPKVTKVGTFRRQAREDAASVAVTPLGPPISSASPTLRHDDDKDTNDEKNKDALAQGTLASLSRGQRKRQAKREQYLRRERMILSTLKLKHQEEQKKRLDGLDALKEALMEVASPPNEVDAAKSEAPGQPANMLKSNKSKRELTLREVTHLNLVLQHPAFQANPMETMQEHLRNTLAPLAKQQSVQSKQREQEDKIKQDVKRQQKKDKMKEAHKSRKKFKAGRTKTKQR
jgi:hypothetical protein